MTDTKNTTSTKHFNPHHKTPYDILYMVMMGDSLSDRGTMNQRMLLGCIPMRYLAKLSQYSPKGRFTNGLVWNDQVIASVASDFTIKHIKERFGWDSTMISDAIITKDRRIKHDIYDNYQLDDDKFVKYKGNVWVRSYCEGGLTAHDYQWHPSWNIKIFFTRLILAVLANKREAIIKYDQEHGIGYEQKGKTLVVEWSGANDLITANKNPTKDEVDAAISARVKNVRKMVAQGYRHFVLFNLPNLGLSPRFQNKSQKKRKQAEDLTHYFNSELDKACAELCHEFPHCSIKSFDINTDFTEIYNNPEKYYFDRDKRHQAYIDSEDFDDPSDGISPAPGYMFYDDVHPTATMHSLLANKFYENLEEQYNLLEPDQTIQSTIDYKEDELCECFCSHYRQALNKHNRGMFGKKDGSTFDFKSNTLCDIIKHALFEDDPIALNVVRELGWLDDSGNLTLDELNHAAQTINSTTVLSIT